MQILKNGSVTAVLLTLLCLILFIYPLFAGSGPVNTRGGGDSPFLYVRLEQLVAGLKAGAWPVRWMPDAAYGLGYPFFNFYAALPYYIAAGFRFLGAGPIVSIQFTQALGLAGAALAMLLLARRLFDHPAAVALAVVAYTCAPFHLVNLYVRGDSLSEFYAFVFYPLIFLALLRLRDKPVWTNVAWLGLSYGGLILTHNLSAIMFSPFVAIYALFLLWHRPRWRTALLMLSGGVLGLALSASLWLTAALELRAVRMSAQSIQVSGYFNYKEHLRGLDLVQPRFFFDYDVAPGSTPFAMGAVQATLIALGALVTLASDARARGRLPGAGIFWVIGLALSTLLITPVLRWLWEHLAILQIVQFPWRFLSVQAFFGALILGRAARALPRPWWWSMAGGALLIAAALGGLAPEYLPVRDADLGAERLALFELFTTNIGTTIRGEYLPIDVEPRPYASAVSLNNGVKPAPVALNGERVQARLLDRDARSERWQVVVPEEATRLAFYTLYFPGWRAKIDGKAVEIAPLPNSGLISLPAPAGRHQIELCFGRTPARWAADLVSLLAVFVILALGWPVVGLLSRRRVCAILVGGGALVIAGAALLGGWLSTPRGANTVDDLSMDFDRMPMLHHNPAGIDFGGRARLARYTYSKERVQSGDVLTVTLTWAQIQDGWRADLQLVSPADAHQGFAPAPPPLALAWAHLQGNETRHVLAVPPDAASGLYYLALRVSDDQGPVRALTAQGNTLGTIYLRPLWVARSRPAAQAGPVLARFGDRILLYDNVQVTAAGQYWDVKLTWQAVAPAPINYTCSLRMLAADGSPIAQRDFEGGPGYGFWPTSAWAVGERVTDRLRLPAPPGVRAEDAAAVAIVLYDRSQPNFPAAGSVVAPLVEREHRYDLPAMGHRVGADFGGRVKLQGYDLIREESTIRLKLHWQSIRKMPGDYSIFVHLYDPQSEEIVSQADVRPLNGLYPTSWWRVGEVISDQVTLSLAGVAPGEYALAVGLYDPQDGARLPVTAASGQAAADGRLVLSLFRIE